MRAALVATLVTALIALVVLGLYWILITLESAHPVAPYIFILSVLWLAVFLAHLEW